MFSNRNGILLLLAVILLMGILFGFHQPPNRINPEQTVKSEYVSSLQNLALLGEQLTEKSKLWQQGTLPLKDLRHAYFELRSQYKEQEYLIEFLDPEFVENNINGAPLRTLEPNTSAISVLEPNGLQIIEELLFSEDQESIPVEKITELTNDLSKSLQELLHYQRTVNVNARHVFEAARQHMVRVFTLGVSGFDSPALFSMHDAQTSLTGLRDEFKNFRPLIAEYDQDLASQIFTRLDQMIAYVSENQDFEAFDRLYFLTEYVNPLYRDIYLAQRTVGIENMVEVMPLYMKHAHNIESDNLFAKDFLNRDYYLRAPSEKLEDNKVIALGKVLFFDPVLSANNERSCASCHNPQLAFTDGRPKSLAMNFNGTLQRNAPTLVNAVFADRYFYDLRTNELEDQIDHVVTSHQEFHTNYLEVFDKLSQSEAYLEMFKKAFPELEEIGDYINKYALSTAIGAYVASLSSFNSPFDKFVRGESDLLDESVKSGFNLFMGKAACGTCHFAPVFNGLVPPHYRESESEVLGVPVNKDTINAALDPDLGRFGGLLKERSDIYRNSFKTTTIRNAALTAPYMHNGVYSTLEEVIDFYNKGGGTGLGLDVPNQTLPEDNLELTNQEKKDLVAFIESLTDTTGLTSMPTILPEFPEALGWNDRQLGGKY